MGGGAKIFGWEGARIGPPSTHESQISEILKGGWDKLGVRTVPDRSPQTRNSRQGRPRPAGNSSNSVNKACSMHEKIIPIQERYHMHATGNDFDIITYIWQKTSILITMEIKLTPPPRQPYHRFQELGEFQK